MSSSGHQYLKHIVWKRTLKNKANSDIKILHLLFLAINSFDFINFIPQLYIYITKCVSFCVQICFQRKQQNQQKYFFCFKIKPSKSNRRMVAWFNTGNFFQNWKKGDRIMKLNVFDISSAHISKWELVCKFGVIFHICIIISCLGSRFHAWN